jgi:hypothetical protein
MQVRAARDLKSLFRNRERVSLVDLFMSLIQEKLIRQYTAIAGCSWFSEPRLTPNSGIRNDQRKVDKALET